MKNTLLIITLIGVTSVALISGVYASRQNGFQEFGRGGGMMNQRFGSGANEYSSKITKTAKNIPNGIEITMTTSDSGALSHLNAMYELSKDLTSTNTAIKREKTKIDNGIKVTITSENTDVLKLIQEKGANGQGFGMMGGKGSSRGGLGQGRGSQRGMMGGDFEGGCPMR